MTLTKCLFSLAIGIALPILLPCYAQAPDKADVVAFCATNAKTGTTEELAYCAAGVLAKDELEKCAQGSCFGVSFPAIAKYGPCGGEDSVARAVLGDACPAICNGPASPVSVYNASSSAIRPKVKGQCDSHETRPRLAPGEGVTITDTGESHYWFWTGGISRPLTNCGGHQAASLTNVRGGQFDEDTRGGKWKLLTGHTYEFRDDYGCVVPHDVTPMYPRY